LAHCQRDCSLLRLIILVLAAYIANALAVGFGGSVRPRYTARIVWLLPVGVMLALLQVRFAGPVRIQTAPQLGRKAHPDAAVRPRRCRFHRVPADAS
jgi:hypothetical protein